MASALEFDTADFSEALTELAKNSNRSARDLVTMNATGMLKAIVYNSPRLTGTMNGGWMAAWSALDVPGYPKNTPRNKYAKTLLAKRGRKYVSDGTFSDNRRSIADPSVTFWNKSHYTEGGRKVNYPHIVAAKMGFMRKAEKEFEGKLQDMLDMRYRQLMRRRS